MKDLSLDLLFFTENFDTATLLVLLKARHHKQSVVVATAKV